MSANGREDLLHKLVQSVTAVQMKYGFHSGLAIEDDHCVSLMCRSIENVLLHKAKFRKLKTNIMKETDDDVLVWDLVSRFLTKSEMVRFENEASLTSGIGRFRSWLRSALNDGLAEKYLQQMVQTDINLLRNFYEDDSIMLDKGLCESLPGVISGMSTVLFAFDLDRPALNMPLRLDRTASATVTAKPIKPPLQSNLETKGKRKMKRPEIAEIVDFDAPVIVEPSIHSEGPDILKLSGFRDDLDLKNLLVHLIPQQITSSDEDYQAKSGGVLQEISGSLPGEQLLKPETIISVSDILEESFEVGMIPDITVQDNENKKWLEDKAEQETLTNTNIRAETIVEESKDIGISDQSASSEGILSDECEARQTADLLKQEVGEDRRGGDEGKWKEEECVGLRNQTMDSYSCDPYEDDLPRSSPVISKARLSKSRIIGNKSGSVKYYTPSVEDEVIGRYTDIQSFDFAVDKEEEGTLTKTSSSYPALSGSIGATDSSSPSSATRYRTTSAYAVPAVPANKNALSRSQSHQLTERLPPLGSPVRTEFDIGQFSNNYDAISISSDLSSFRDYGISFRSTGDGIEHDVQSDSTSYSAGLSYTAGELRTVLSALMQQKDEIEEQNSFLQETLGREMATRESLKGEIEQMQKIFIQRQSHDQAVIRGLQRENQMLKQQLKKYVTVIQQLRREEVISDDHDVAAVLVEVPVIQPLQLPTPANQNSFDNASLEHKLAQVSEMHGELLELNQQLVTKNMAREKQLQQMETKLQQIETKEAARREKKAENKTHVDFNFSDFQLVESPLLQMWIPAAMIRGTGSKKYHVYQIITQVPGEQWTIYRRYAEFKLFHKLLVQKHPYFAKLELPGRNHFNRKVPSVVEERRGKLEVYLQRVTSNLADRKLGINTQNMDLITSPCKAAVTSAIHFLRDQQDQNEQYAGL